MEVSFICEWLTPALWHGANPTGSPEVRSASIKGLIRYWWRAWVGGLAKSSQELYQWEEAIFGSTQHASPLIIRAYPEPSHEEPRGKGPRGGLAWAEGQKWCVEFRARWGYTPPESSLAYPPYTPLWWGIGSFWLLQSFGGIGYGSRSRNGKFRAKPSSPSNFEEESNQKVLELLDLLWPSPNSFYSQCETLRKLMEMAKEVINQRCSPSNRQFSPKSWDYLILIPSEIRQNCKERIAERRKALGKQRFQRGRQKGAQGKIWKT
ncbi:MAG: type III-B CRISPR module RAMP protein Cmr1 [Bacteroidia bacterium]